jgi:eukaryotic-like serine/threonine-protein kinase
LKQAMLSNDSTNQDDGTNRHIARLVALQHWARPLGLGEGAVTFHVIEAINPADALLDYTRTNHVDHIIMGARAESLARNMLGSVSAQVAAHAPCTVSVVRQRAWPENLVDART